MFLTVKISKISYEWSDKEGIQVLACQANGVWTTITATCLSMLLIVNRHSSIVVFQNGSHPSTNTHTETVCAVMWLQRGTVVRTRSLAQSSRRKGDSHWMTPPTRQPQSSSATLATSGALGSVLSPSSVSRQAIGPPLMLLAMVQSFILIYILELSAYIQRTKCSLF